MKTLVLNRETIRALQDSELTQIIGGGPDWGAHYPGLEPRESIDYCHHPDPEAARAFGCFGLEGLPLPVTTGP